MPTLRHQMILFLLAVLSLVFVAFAIQALVHLARSAGEVTAVDVVILVFLLGVAGVGIAGFVLLWRAGAPVHVRHVDTQRQMGAALIRPDRREVRLLAARLLPVIAGLNPAGVDDEVAVDEYGHLASQVAYRALGDSPARAADWLASELIANWGFEPEFGASAAEVVLRALRAGISPRLASSGGSDEPR